MRAVLKWLIRMLAAIGLCALALAGLFLVLSRGWPIVPEMAHFGPPIVSPEGTHKAVVITYDEGVGISPHCYKKVTILAADVPPEQGQSDDAVVFEGSCDSFSPVGGRVEPSLRIEWVSADILRITFSIQTTAMRAATVKLRKQDESGSIQVRFEVRE